MNRNEYINDIAQRVANHALDEFGINLLTHALIKKTIKKHVKDVITERLWKDIQDDGARLSAFADSTVLKFNAQVAQSYEEYKKG